MRRLMLILVVALVASACGGDDDGGGDLSGAEAALADAIADQIVADNEGFAVSQADAQCFGNRAVSGVGLDKLVSYGLDEAAVRAGTGPDEVDVDDADADTLVDAFVDCIDIGQALADSIVADSGGAISDNSANCIADGVGDDIIRAAARSGITGEESPEEAEALAGLFGVITDCLTPEELGALSG